MTTLTKSYNKNLSKKLITKTTTAEDWYSKELKQSYKEVKGFWYEKEYK